MEKRVISLPRWLKAVPVLGLALLFVVVISMAPAKASAQALPDASICLPPVVCATVTVPGPTITLPGRTITLPGRTVTLPRATSTQTVTSRVKVPGPVTTRNITQSPKVLYRTTTVTQTGQTVTKSATVPTVTVTATRTDVRTVDRERVINLTKPQATGISLGLVAVGALMALLVLYIMYRLGYLRAEGQNAEDWQQLRDSLKE